MPEEGRQDGLTEMRSEFASNQAEIEAKEEELRKLEKYVEGLRSMLTEFEELPAPRETSSFSDVLAQALGEMRALGALHQRLGRSIKPTSEPVSRPPTELETRGEALDRQLGPVPEELLLKVPWPPKEGEGTTPPKHEEGDGWPLPAREGYEVDITERKLPDGALGYVRTKKETPSERASRIALLEYEARDTD